MKNYILKQPVLLSDCIKHSKERAVEYKRFKDKHGFTPDETWSLDYSLAIFIYPRLRYFVKHTIGYPTNFRSLKSWKRCIYKMLYYFRKVINDEMVSSDPKYNQGAKLFGKYFQHLWY